jgi:hypothetical protein
MQHDLVVDFVEYAPDGRLTWRRRTLENYLKHGLASRGVPNLERWNEANEGKPAFAMRTATGGLYGEFFGKRFAADRVAWLINAKAWPTFYLHHINGDKADNRMENLSSIKTSNLLTQRLAHGWRSTDRLRWKWNATWVVRDGEDFQKVDSENRPPSQLESLMRHLNMVH